MPNRPASRLQPLASAIVAMAIASGCDVFKPEGPDIPFAPYDKSYASKPDFAQVEYRFPLSTAQRAQVTPEYLARLDQEQLDQLYARLTAGPIPNGSFDGRVIFPRGASGTLRAAEVMGEFASTVLQLKGLAVEGFAEFLWKGKVFYRDQRIVRNRIEDRAALSTLGLLEVGGRSVAIATADSALLFPAKLYCGQSLLDARRESIIIDYFFTDEIEGYQEKPDYLAGRRGLRVRDEIRMVRPGFYLGRAYLDRLFALNFILYNRDIAERETETLVETGATVEDCWVGTQAHRTARVP